MGYLVRQQFSPWVNVRDSRMTPVPSVGNVHRVAEGCHGTLAAAALLGQFAINSPATPKLATLAPHGWIT
jgi:hypothetical protein